MQYEVVPSKLDAGTWLAEAIDHESEGEIYCASFYGQKAKERAQEYAAWKNEVRPAQRASEHRAIRTATPTTRA